MSKELFISSSPHETKIAVMEDDNLVEVFYQRDTDVGLVGGIYKGRVSRVLPGMQSAFVDIGLGRDAFLYVSDFFEDSDEYDRVATEAETRVGKYTAPEPAPSAPRESDPPLAAANPEPSLAVPIAAASPAPAVESPAPPASTAPSGSERAAGPAPTGQSSGGPPRWEESRGRSRRRRRGRGFGGKYEPREHRGSENRPTESSSSSSSGSGIELLPGETLAKFAHLHQETPSPAEDERGWGAAPAVDLAGASAAGEETNKLTGAIEPFEQHLPGDSAAPPPEAFVAHPSAVMQEGQTPESAIPSPSDHESGSEPFTAPAAAVSSIEAPAEASKYRIEEELLAGNLRLASVPEPDAPSHALSQMGKPATGGEKAGRAMPGSKEPALPSSASSAAENVGGFGESSEIEAALAGEMENDVDLQVEAEEEIELEVEDTTAETGEELAGDEEGTGEPAEPVPAAEGSAEETASDSPGGTPSDSGDRSYALRDSNQRPRFAPRRGRRGRGRFGRRGERPEGPAQQRPDRPRGGNEQAVQINEVLKEGQEILVQIAKEPLGTKGARITSHIALPGRYLVYMPTIQHIGVSRKIASEEERLRLRNLILEHRGSLTNGVIVRTAAAGRSDDELKADVDFLARLWNEIRNRAERSKAPALIHRDLTLVERILRDILSPDFKTVRVDNELEYQGVLDFVDRFQPSLVGHVKLYSKDTPIFEEFGIQGEIDKALKPKVWLKSGGYIVINQTEALVAIDVNTGKYVGRTNRLEDTIVKTNIDAVKEIVRQIRLRDVGGIIVIDFIDMDDRRNRMKVVQALEEALRSDRAPTKILSFNEFGLVALTRKRVKQSLERTLSEPCAYCAGSGWIKSVTTVCYEILEEARKMAQEIDGKVLTLRVNPEVARALKSREGSLTAELESLTGKDVVIKIDPNVHQERFEIF